VDRAVRDRAAAAALAFEELGCSVEEIALDLDDPYEALYVLMASSSAGGHRDDFEAVRDRVDPGRLPTIEDGFRLTAADVGAATIRRGRFGDALRTALEPYDLLLTPTTPVTAFASDLHAPPDVAGEERPGLSWTAFTYPFNLSGQPAASVPCPHQEASLPVGLQIVGRWRDDSAVLAAAAAYEAVRPWSHVVPPLAR
jgi:aspartyl-tRNA(Asn)/glutamyl-tRNA(Gln) amidotransferase subunit A